MSMIVGTLWQTYVRLTIYWMYDITMHPWSIDVLFSFVFCCCFCCVRCALFMCRLDTNRLIFISSKTSLIFFFCLFPFSSSLYSFICLVAHSSIQYLIASRLLWLLQLYLLAYATSFENWNTARWIKYECDQIKGEYRCIGACIILI